MCHTPGVKQDYYNYNNRYAAPVTAAYNRVTPVNTNYQPAYRPKEPNYWNLCFMDANGVEQKKIINYTVQNEQVDFFDCVQEVLKPYGALVQDVTLVIPSAYCNIASEITVSNQRDFTRALSMIPQGSAALDAGRGLQVRVRATLDDKDSGYVVV